jgi:ABC-2 type transport system ATP-binding protein
MRDMRALIHQLASEGITVLLSSHLMSEVEELCDRVAIVSRGRVIHEGSLEDLIASSAGGYALRTTDDARAAAVARDADGVSEVEAADGGLAFRARDEDAVAELSLALARAGVAIVALVPRTASLEELFFRLTEGQPEAAPEPEAGHSLNGRTGSTLPLAAGSARGAGA